MKVADDPLAAGKKTAGNPRITEKKACIDGRHLVNLLRNYFIL